MSDISTILEMLSAVTGLTGALLLALKCRFAPWAWAAWMVSNLGWIVFGLNAGHWGLVAQNAGFLITSGIGCWTWLLRPYFEAKHTRTPQPLRNSMAR